MGRFHAALGFGVVGAFLLLLLLGLLSLVLKRPASQWFWRLLAALQVILLLQVVVGSVLLLMGRRQPLLHYLYGGLFPLAAVAVAHVLARRLDDERDAARIFTVAALFGFGLTLRALATGLGIG